METKTYTTIDRSEKGWPSGPWDSEPDKMQWPDDSTGLPCLAVRHSRSGHWCGYVGVAEGHRYFGAGYDDVSVDVHCGLTFAGPCQPGETEHKGICHVPGPGDPDQVWWLGFDCAHCDDASPQDFKHAEERGYPFIIHPDEKYRDLAYVQEQCRQLAAQLASA